MGRSINHATFAAPAVCDVCHRPCCTMDQAGIVCYHCGKGVFLHRRFWTFAACTACACHPEGCCPECGGTGLLAYPRADLDTEDLRAEWRGLPERYIRAGRAVPAPVADRARWATE